MTRAIIVAALVSRTGSLGAAFSDLTAFDGAWYAHIVSEGYNYSPDGHQYDVAFFPLYPALVWLAMRTGASFAVASLAISNVAFLGALFVAFAWMRARASASAARWTVATLCCSPLSLFCSAAYSESLFLLLTGAALLDWSGGRSRIVALWALLASATRLIGISFAPAFAVRRAWLPAAASLAGTVGFAIFCAVKFGDPLAFVHAQAAWRPQSGFNGRAWQDLLGAGVATAPWLHAIAAIAAVALFVVHRRAAIGLQTLLWFVLLEAERWAWNGSEYVFLFTLIAASCAIAFRRSLGAVALTALLAGVALIAVAGPPLSVDRLAYGLLPASAALALLWTRVPAMGLAALAVMVIDLVEFSVRFSEQRFIA